MLPHLPLLSGGLFNINIFDKGFLLLLFISPPFFRKLLAHLPTATQEVYAKMVSALQIGADAALKDSITTEVHMHCIS